MKSAANHPMTATKKPAITRNTSTKNCGMARISRKTTVARRCGSVPENHISTRLVGTDMETFVM